MRKLTAALAVLAALATFASCSNDDDATADDADPPTTLARPDVPHATISGPITGGTGSPVLLDTGQHDLTAAGYRQDEFFAEGTARSFRAAGTLESDGRWRVEPDQQARFRTRILVRRPADPTRFNGTLLVEWLNVSAGGDSAPDYAYLRDEIERSGYAWVGVSAQQVGVSGGEALVGVSAAPSGGLRAGDPDRYGSLVHPGDAFAFDLFAQVGAALRTPGGVDPLGGLRAQHVLALGESQSAIAMTTFVNAVHPLTRVFDGFFVHSRGGGAFGLDGKIDAGISGGVHIRDDVDVPVLLFETETDETLLRYHDARQPDSEHVRLWDVAGAAHADTYIVGPFASTLNCGEINAAPTYTVLHAALAQLSRWVRTGTAPAPAPRIEIEVVDGTPTVRRDELGNALGGLRMPAVAVPVAAHSGEAHDLSNLLCGLFGSTRPFDAPTLTRLHGTPARYRERYAEAVDDAIARGHLLRADRDVLLAEAAKITW